MFVILIPLLSFLLYVGPVQSHQKAEDKFVRDRVVLLETPDGGFCTGIEVTAKSGRTVTLTAAHCISGVSLMATTEYKTKHLVKLIEEDVNSDLAIYEGVPGVDGVEVADKVVRGQHVRAITHGDALPTYTTEGIVLDTERYEEVPLYPLRSPDEVASCLSKPKYMFMMAESDQGSMIPACALHIKTIWTTAWIVPGSSGGPLVDDNGRLLGIASATVNYGKFAANVRLADIQAFLAKF